MLALTLAVAWAGGATGPPADTVVVRGTVVEAHTQDAAHGLETRYVVHVDESLRGVAPSVVTLTLPGGVADGLRMTVRGVPLFRVGDDAIVSLRDRPPLPLYGHFRVDGDHLRPAVDGWPTQVAALELALATPTARGSPPD